MKLLIITILFSSLLFASGKEGHGGSSVVCRDGQGHLTSVVTLDLFEAREDDLRLPEREGSAEEIALSLLDTVLAASRRDFDRLPEYLADVISRKKLTKPGVGVQPVNDVFPTIRPKECKIEPLANYEEDGTVRIDGEFFGRLSNTERAALYWHEALYRLLRETEKATDSRKARRINGYLFSDRDFAEWWSRTAGESEKPKVPLKLYENIESQDCRAWREEVRRRLAARADFVYADCGRDSHAVIHVRPKGEAIVVQENVRAELHSKSDEAWADYRKRCADWKEALGRRFGQDLFYAHCGEPEAGAWRFGWEPHSRGTFVVFVHGPVDTVPSRVLGERFGFNPGDLEGEARAFRQARADFARRCQALKEQGKGDTKRIYVSCEGADAEIQDHPYATTYSIIDDNYWMRATAQTYRYR